MIAEGDVTGAYRSCHYHINRSADIEMPNAFSTSRHVVAKLFCLSMRLDSTKLPHLHCRVSKIMIQHTFLKFVALARQAHGFGSIEEKCIDCMR